MSVDAFVTAIPTAEETAEDAKARATRQAQLESDWAASVSEKGLGHGNARKKLNAAVLEDQDSYPKAPPRHKASSPKPTAASAAAAPAKQSTPTKQKKSPTRRTAWGEPSSLDPKENVTAGSSPATTPLKDPKQHAKEQGKAIAKVVASKSADEAETRRLKNLKKKAAQKRKKAAAAAASTSHTGAGLEGVAADAARRISAQG
eukprot:COSAG06_NODE_994_length_11156_cov_13.068089_7_plen_203_part_00